MITIIIAGRIPCVFTVAVLSKVLLASGKELLGAVNSQKSNLGRKRGTLNRTLFT
jgi:hypothetical protein